MYVLLWRTASALTRVLFCCLFPSLLRNSENKHQNNPLVSAETARHSSSYIILYFISFYLNMSEWCKCIFTAGYTYTLILTSWSYSSEIKDNDFEIGFTNELNSHQKGKQLCYLTFTDHPIRILLNGNEIKNAIMIMLLQLLNHYMWIAQFMVQAVLLWPICKTLRAKLSDTSVAQCVSNIRYPVSCRPVEDYVIR